MAVQTPHCGLKCSHYITGFQSVVLSKNIQNIFISCGGSSVVSEKDNINTPGQLFHSNHNMETCCIIFLMCFLSISKPRKHFIIQPFGVSVGLHGSSTDRWGTSIHQEQEDERGNAEKQENWWHNEGKEGCKNLTGRTKHRDRVGGCRKDYSFIIAQVLLISTVCKIGRWNLFSLYLDAQSHT